MCGSVEGKGDATIQEVSFQSKLITPQEEEEDKSANKQLQKELDQLCEREKALNAKVSRLTKQRTVLEGFADSVTKPMPIPVDKDKTEVHTNFIARNSKHKKFAN